MIYVHDGSETLVDQFEFDLADGAGGVLVGQSLQLTVNPVNDAPIATGENRTLHEDHVATGNVLSNDTDAENSPLTAQLVSGPGRAADFTLNADGSFSYTPNANYHGNDSFSYRVFDGQAYSATVTVSLGILPVNDLAVAKPDQFTVLQGEFLDSVISVLDNDLDVENEALTAVLLQQPNNGTVVLQNDGTFLYFPKPGFSGADTFTYAANDGSGVGNATTVEILVQAPLPETESSGGGSGTDPIDPDNNDPGPDPGEQDNEQGRAQKVFFLSPELISRHDSRFDYHSQRDSDEVLFENLESQKLDIAGATRRQAIDVLQWAADNQQALRRNTIGDLLLDSQPRMTFVYDQAELLKQFSQLEKDALVDLEFTVATSSIAVSAGIILWVLRGGMLMATVLGSTPTWKFLDPLEVLQSGKDDAAEKLFGEANK